MSEEVEYFVNEKGVLFFDLDHRKPYHLEVVNNNEVFAVFNFSGERLPLPWHKTSIGLRYQLWLKKTKKEVMLMYVLH